MPIRKEDEQAVVVVNTILIQIRIFLFMFLRVYSSIRRRRIRKFRRHNPAYSLTGKQCHQFRHMNQLIWPCWQMFLWKVRSRTRQPQSPTNLTVRFLMQRTRLFVHEKGCCFRWGGQDLHAQQLAHVIHPHSPHLTARWHHHHLHRQGDALSDRTIELIRANAGHPSHDTLLQMGYSVTKKTVQIKMLW